MSESFKSPEPNLLRRLNPVRSVPRFLGGLFKLDSDAPNYNPNFRNTVGTGSYIETSDYVKIVKGDTQASPSKSRRPKQPLDPQIRAMQEFEAEADQIDDEFEVAFEKLKYVPASSTQEGGSRLSENIRVRFESAIATANHEVDEEIAQRELTDQLRRNQAVAELARQAMEHGFDPSSRILSVIASAGEPTRPQD